jgi:hypothetical protein
VRRISFVGWYWHTPGHVDWLYHFVTQVFVAGLGMFVLFLAAAMQVGACVTEWVGVRMLGPFRLSNLTSPATAAMELERHYLARQS